MKQEASQVYDAEASKYQNQGGSSLWFTIIGIQLKIHKKF